MQQNFKLLNWNFHKYNYNVAWLVLYLAVIDQVVQNARFIFSSIFQHPGLCYFQAIE